MPLRTGRRFLLICSIFFLGSGTASAASVVVEGRGYGHGVGMSQYGAEGFALHGWSYRKILAHYYPGTALKRQPSVTVRVLLAEARTSVTIGSRSPYRVRDSRGRTVKLPAGQRRLRTGIRVLQAAHKQKLRPPLTFLPGAQPLRLDGAEYRGELVWSAGDVVNVLPLELYLRGVVSFEMPHRWMPEALKAQAVAARSYALATLRRRATFDVYPDTRDQMYGGVRAETPQTNAAVGATAGLAVTWRGRVAITYYCSTSGGRTAAATDVLPWAPRVPYLRAVSDPYDALSPHHTWRHSFSVGRVAALLGVPRLASFAIRTNGSGRVADVVVRWRGGSRTISARDFEHALDLPSTWFSVRVAGARPAHHPATQARLTGWIVVVSSAPKSDARPAGHVLDSSRFSTLRPGFWVVYRGPYASRAAAAAHAGGGYVRKLGS